MSAEGKLRNESWIKAAKRGLKEELKLEAKKWENLGEFFTDPGGLEQKYQLFVASDLVPTKKVNIQHPCNDIEELRVKNFSRQEIEQMISNGEICDNWTLAGLYLFDRYISK